MRGRAGLLLVWDRPSRGESEVTAVSEPDPVMDDEGLREKDEVCPGKKKKRRSPTCWVEALCALAGGNLSKVVYTAGLVPGRPSARD